MAWSRQTGRQQPGGSRIFSGRQMEAGRPSAGAGRHSGASHRISAMEAPSRLDPFSLPVRFTAADAAADGALRVVDLHRERVVVRRAVRGMRMALNMPVASFRGVAIRLYGESGAPCGDAHPPRSQSCSSTPIRRCRSLCSPRRSPTTSSPNGSRGAACWACLCWSPKPTANCASRSRGMGGVRLQAPTWRRRRRTAIARRRPSRLLRRRAGTPQSAPAVHRGEREIIAQD